MSLDDSVSKGPDDDELPFERWLDILIANRHELLYDAKVMQYVPSPYMTDLRVHTNPAEAVRQIMAWALVHDRLKKELRRFALDKTKSIIATEPCSDIRVASFLPSTSGPLSKLSPQYKELLYWLSSRDQSNVEEKIYTSLMPATFGLPLLDPRKFRLASPVPYIVWPQPGDVCVFEDGLLEIKTRDLEDIFSKDQLFVEMVPATSPYLTEEVPIQGWIGCEEPTREPLIPANHDPLRCHKITTSERIRFNKAVNPFDCCAATFLLIRGAAEHHRLVLDDCTATYIVNQTEEITERIGHNDWFIVNAVTLATDWNLKYYSYRPGASAPCGGSSGHLPTAELTSADRAVLAERDRDALVFLDRLYPFTSTNVRIDRARTKILRCTGQDLNHGSIRGANNPTNLGINSPAPRFEQLGESPPGTQQFEVDATTSPSTSARSIPVQQSDSKANLAAFAGALASEYDGVASVLVSDSGLAGFVGRSSDPYCSIPDYKFCFSDTRRLRSCRQIVVTEMGAYPSTPLSGLSASSQVQPTLLSNEISPEMECDLTSLCHIDRLVSGLQHHSVDILDTPAITAELPLRAIYKLRIHDHDRIDYILKKALRPSSIALRIAILNFVKSKPDLVAVLKDPLPKPSIACTCESDPHRSAFDPVIDETYLDVEDLIGSLSPYRAQLLDSTEIRDCLAEHEYTRVSEEWDAYLAIEHLITIAARPESYRLRIEILRFVKSKHNLVPILRDAKVSIPELVTRSAAVS